MSQKCKLRAFDIETCAGRMYTLKGQPAPSSEDAAKGADCNRYDRPGCWMFQNLIDA
jgi:hypothetical protein